MRYAMRLLDTLDADAMFHQPDDTLYRYDIAA